MRKIIWLLMLMVMLVVGMAQADEGSVCPECDLYTHEMVIPYLTADAGWWNGIAVTNSGAEPILCRIEYISDNDIKRFDVAGKSVVTFIASIKKTGYAKLLATGPGQVTLMVGDETRLQGFLFELRPVPVSDLSQYWNED